MIYQRFVNFFLSYISKKWLLACLVTGLLIWIMAFASELFIRSQRGRDFDHQFMGELFLAIIPCVLIPFGIYLAVILIITVVALERYKDELIFNFHEYFERVRKPFIVNIELKADEKKVYEVRRAKLKMPDRFTFYVYFLVSDKRIYVHGGVLGLKKYSTGLRSSGIDEENAFNYFAFSDINLINSEIYKNQNWLTVNLKNKKTFWLIIPPDPNFPKNIFPKNV